MIPETKTSLVRKDVLSMRRTDYHLVRLIGVVCNYYRLCELVYKNIFFLSNDIANDCKISFFIFVFRTILMSTRHFICRLVILI